METITIKIKKPYAKEVIADLEKMDAITTEKLPISNPTDLIGSWASESQVFGSLIYYCKYVIPTELLPFGVLFFYRYFALNRAYLL